MKINRSDVDIVAFARSKGAGGQNVNKVATAIRMTHIPTGEVVVASSERTQGGNLKAAWKALSDRLDSMLARARAAGQRLAWMTKPDASFGSQIRSYSQPNRSVIDHRTGKSSDFDSVVRRGKLDGFMRSTMVARASQ